MPGLAFIRRQFNEDGKIWFEAEIENQIRVRFPAPEGFEIKCGDVIFFDRCYLGREFSTMVFRDIGSAKICVTSHDDLRDRRPILQIRREKTVVRLLRTLEVETNGPHIGSSSPFEARYDDLESYEDYVFSVAKTWLGPQFDSVGPVELRRAHVDWVQSEVVPKLKVARDDFKKGIA